MSKLKLFLFLFSALWISCTASALPAADDNAQAATRKPQTPPEVSKWNPLTLDTAASPEQVKAYKESFDVNMATAGYLYALPAYIDYLQRYSFLSAFTQYMGASENPFGHFLLLSQPASPQAVDVMPNYDTLYGVAFLELKGLPMVLSVPDIPDRYYSFALVDAYFYNFAYVGSRTSGQKAGNYLLVAPGWSGQTPPGISRVIHCPTSTIHIYQRIYFRNQQDVPAVNVLQGKIKLLPLANFLDPTAKVQFPDPARYMTVNPADVTTPLQVLEVANRHMGENPPPLEDQTMVDYFAPVGIGPGLTLPTDPYATEVLRKGSVEAGHAMTELALVGFVTRNGWQIPPPNVGKHGGPGGMALQAMIQLRSVGINASDEAVYYFAYDDADAKPLNSANRYILKFTRNDLPPIQKDKFGFWSITMYDRANLKLVANSSDKYTVRSGDPFVYGDDGSLTIYIQPEPPAEKKLFSNWLPSPKQGDFVLALRVYLGGKDVVDGSYVPPAAFPAKP